MKCLTAVKLSCVILDKYLKRKKHYCHNLPRPLYGYRYLTVTKHRFRTKKVQGNYFEKGFRRKRS